MGAVKTIIYISLIIGFVVPRIALFADVMVILTALTTLSMLPQIGLNSFTIKDILLVGSGCVLLKYDYLRYQKINC